MKKSALILFTTISFLLISVNAFAVVKVCNGADCYYYYSHWLSDTAWGDEVSDFSKAEKVYCNVSAREVGYNPPAYDLRWFKPNGDLVTPTTLVYKYSGGIMVGIYGWLAMEGVYREPGEWRVEHWAGGSLLFTAYFTIPSRAMLSISPDSFHFIEFIDSFDSPGSSPTGLTFDGTYLWNADDSADKIYKLDLSGTILASFDSPGSSPKGLTFDGYCLWNANYWTNTIYKLDLSGTILASFDSPGYGRYGLTYEGIYFWNADLIDDKIYKLVPPGTIIASFDSPGSSPTGLTFDGTYLWNADASANKIYKLDLSGTIIDSFDSPGSSPKGLAFDGTYLWVADDSDDKIYKWVTQGVNIGSSVSQTFTIISNGDENLAIGTFTITGADASEFTIENDTCLGQTLTPMETCTFDVIFLPLSAGKKTASLEISSNDVFSKKIVPLSGTGEKRKAMPWIHLLLFDD